MKKIAFSDKYGLTRAVLAGQKTMTRRIVPDSIVRMAEKEVEICGGAIEDRILDHAPILEGEIVAIAQRYIDLKDNNRFYEALAKADPSFPLECIAGEKGCYNKMFVKASWMPNRIKIIRLRVERLQDITSDDAYKEGIRWEPQAHKYAVINKHLSNGMCIYEWLAEHWRDAFACLIDKISGKGTWEKNPFVFVYEFKLI